MEVDAGVPHHHVYAQNAVVGQLHLDAGLAVGAFVALGMVVDPVLAAPAVGRSVIRRALMPPRLDDHHAFLANDRLVAGVGSGAFRKYQGLFRRFAQSFRPLTADDRGRISELRVRSAYALEGETITQLSQRTGNEWGPSYTAVVNGLFVDEVLSAGQRLKIAVPEPYASPAETGPEGDERGSSSPVDGAPAGGPEAPS